MIEEFTDFDDLDSEYNWIEKVEEKLLTTILEDKKTIQQNNDTWTGHISLEINKFEDSIEINIDKDTFDVTVIEEMYTTSDSRDNNIRFIKMFVEREMPYYKFDKVKNFSIDADEHGFTIFFKKFEVKA